MKILNISNGIYPYRRAGTEIYTARLASTLAGLGHVVDVAVPDPRGIMVGDASALAGGAHVHAIATAPRTWYGNKLRYVSFRRPLWRERLARLALDVNPDVIHVHHLDGFGMSALRLVTDLGRPTVVTLPDFWLLCPGIQRRCGGDLRSCARICVEGRWARWLGVAATRTYLLWRRSMVSRFVDRARPTLAAISDSTRSIFEAEGFPVELLITHPWGSDCDPLRACTYRAHDESARPRIGYLGTMRPHKGCHVLLEAFRRLDRPGSLHFHGDGDAGYVAGLRRDAGTAAVHFHGKYEPIEVGSVLAGLDLVVIPSVWEETYCLVYQEAIAARKPVIASKVGGLADRVVDGVNGFLVPPNDPAALAARIAEVVENPRAIDALDFDRAALGLDQDALGWLELYEETIARQRRRS